MARRNFMNIRLCGPMLAAAVLGFATVAAAAPDPGADLPTPHLARVTLAPRPVSRGGPKNRRVDADLVQRVQVLSQARRIDINNINMFVTNFGTFANDIENQSNSGLFFPKGTVKTAVYQSGIWLVGKQNGQLRAAI